MPYIGLVTAEEDLIPKNVSKEPELYQKEIERLLSASLLDRVSSVQPFRYAILVDDEGGGKKKPVNRIATLFYAKNARHTLLGDAAIVRVDPIRHDWEPFATLEECEAALQELLMFIIA